jgi:hypothetical protein
MLDYGMHDSAKSGFGEEKSNFIQNIKALEYSYLRDFWPLGNE